MLFRKLLLFLLCIKLTCSFAVGPGDLVLIGNNIGNKALKKSLVSSSFKGKFSIWPNGEAVIVVLPSSKASHVDAFSKEYMNMSMLEMQKFWFSLVFQGRASPPVFIDSSEEMLDYVKRHPGAIAVIDMPLKSIPEEFRLNMLP